MTNLYTDLDAMLDRLDIESASDNAQILQAIEDASRWLDAATARKFYPEIATYSFDYQGADALSLGRFDLISLTTLTTNNGGTAIDSGNVFLTNDGDYNLTPYNQIAIDSGTSSEFTYTGTAQKSQTVTGIFGFHDDYSNAYSNVNTLAGDQSDSATTATVSNGNLFSPGQTIRIGTEWQYISSIANNVLTVKRGMNGSTAAAHLTGVTVERYAPMVDVVRATLRLATWLYKQNASPMAYELQTGPDGTVIIPPEAPADVLAFVETYKHPLLKRREWLIFP